VTCWPKAVFSRLALLWLMAAGAALVGCAELAADVAVGALDSALKDECGRNCEPPTGCVSANGVDCQQINDPVWRDRWNQVAPPAGSVRPPPDCTVCSPLSRPVARAVRKPSRRELPDYLMSDACLLDHMRSRGSLR
jgi:hypothetical protein